MELEKERRDSLKKGMRKGSLLLGSNGEIDIGQNG
jgi:hypothetical protein